MLATVSGESTAGEEIVVGLLIGEDTYAGLVRSAAVDGATSKGGMRGYP
jgi:hypothetical protein